MPGHFPDIVPEAPRVMIANRHRLLAAALLLESWRAAAGPADACRREPEDRLRLACYDALFRDGAAAAEPAAAAETPAPPDAGSTLATFWELGSGNKRGTFVVRTYQPNYLLPLHFSSRLNRSPASPTHSAPDDLPDYQPREAKLQISLRAKIAENLPGGADLWFAYTQRSLWQVWNRRESSPFRSTDYQPEAIYILPVPPRLGTLPGGWRWQLLQLGIAHQSNGQSGALSRSWNHIHAGAAFERGAFALQMRVNRRLAESGRDDNPDLLRHLGNTEIGAAWLPGRATAALAWRTGAGAFPRGSLQFDWTYPVDRDQPSGLRWYVQLFSGYGETLLDYNRRQNSIGVGVTLFQF